MTIAITINALTLVHRSSGGVSERDSKTFDEAIGRTKRQ